MLLRHLFYKGVNVLDRIRVYHKKKRSGAAKVPAPDLSLIFLWLWLAIRQHQLHEAEFIAFYRKNKSRPLYFAVWPHSPRTVVPFDPA